MSEDNTNKETVAEVLSEEAFNDVDLEAEIPEKDSGRGNRKFDYDSAIGIPAASNKQLKKEAQEFITEFALRGGVHLCVAGKSSISSSVFVPQHKDRESYKKCAHMLRAVNKVMNNDPANGMNGMCIHVNAGIHDHELINAKNKKTPRLCQNPAAHSAVRKVRFVHCDVDCRGGTERDLAAFISYLTKEVIPHLKYKPNILTRSSSAGGVHMYYAIQTPLEMNLEEEREYSKAVDRIKAVNGELGKCLSKVFVPQPDNPDKRLEFGMNSDSACCNVDRLMRIPGDCKAPITQEQRDKGKTDPTPARLITCSFPDEDSKLPTLEELEEYFCKDWGAVAKCYFATGMHNWHAFSTKKSANGAGAERMSVLTKYYQALMSDSVGGDETVRSIKTFLQRMGWTEEQLNAMDPNDKGPDEFSADQLTEKAEPFGGLEQLLQSCPAIGSVILNEDHKLENLATCRSDFSFTGYLHNGRPKQEHYRIISIHVKCIVWAMTHTMAKIEQRKNKEKSAKASIESVDYNTDRADIDIVEKSCSVENIEKMGSRRTQRYQTSGPSEGASARRQCRFSHRVSRHAVHERQLRVYRGFLR